MMKTIWIDAGHGGTQPGAVSGTRVEKNDALRLATELERQFVAQDCKVIMTRRTDVEVSLVHRTRMEREAKCDLGISCHRNSAGPGATGVETWIHSASVSDTIAWAANVVRGIAELGTPLRLGTVASGVYKGYRDNPKLDYQVNRETNSPTMLLEMGFVTNASDNLFFDAKLSEICAAVVKASCNFLGIEYKATNAGSDGSAASGSELQQWKNRALKAEDALQQIRKLVS